MQIEKVITELGELVGIKELAINEHGVVHLTIEDIGELYIDDKTLKNGHFIFIYLMRMYSFVSANVYEHALSLCDFRHRYPFVINPVLYGDKELGFAIKFTEDNFDVQVLQQAIEVLKNLQDKLGSVGV